MAGLEADGARLGRASDTGGESSFSPVATRRSAGALAQSRGVARTPVKSSRLATQGGAATPGLAARRARAEDSAARPFAQIVRGDDCAVVETWSGGRFVPARDGAALAAGGGAR